MEHLSLLPSGQEHSQADWEKAAADVLRKTGRMTAEDPDALVWERLARRTLDGIEVPALGVAEDLADLPGAGVPGQAPYTRGTVLSRPEEGWDIRAHLADPDPKQAAADALLDLENGATSLWLTVGRGGLAIEDLASVLEKVYLDLAPVVLDCPEDPVGAAEALVALLQDRVVDAAPGTNLGGDPIGARVRGTGSPEVDATVLRLSEIARRHGARALVVDGTAVHDLGGTDAQELGYSLAVGAAYLRILTTAGGLSIDEAASLIEFRYAATVEQLPTMAKLRAARRAWARLLELSGASQAAPGQTQHAVTSRPMTTKYDPWVNMLRGTVAAFSAGVGGASAVTVLPYDAAIGIADVTARRVARNTSSLLIHEAHVARVTDPGGGSFALERLTDDLAAGGWAELRRIEGEGGVLASTEAEDTGLLGRVRERAEARSGEIATRKRPLTGVTEFPNLQESLPERRPWPDEAWTGAEARYARAFEQLRDEPASTPVFLATMGTVAQHTARATFASNLFAAGGVDVVSVGATTTAEDVVKAFRAADPQSPVVCLAGTDAAYAAWGADLVAELREAGATHVILAGKPGGKTVPDRDLDDHCAVGIDALAFLHRVRASLEDQS